MIKHGVLKNWHPMVGCDWHIPWPPPSPAPTPPAVPYFTISVMQGLAITASMANDVLSNYWGYTMLKTTDIGPMIPHIGPPSNLLLVEIPLSSSKSYFGSSRYTSKGKPVAAALLWHLNPNLNCGNPLPTPTGCVIAFTTHEVDMSWGDIMSGVFQMAVDFAIMWALSKLGKAGGPGFNFLRDRVFKAFLPGAEQAAARAGVDKSLQAATAGLNAALQADSKAKVLNWVVIGGLAAAGLLIGSPMGVDASTPGLYGSYSGDHPNIGASQGDHRGGPGDAAAGALGGLADKGGQAVGNYLDGGNPSGYPKDIGSHGVTD